MRLTKGEESPNLLFHLIRWVKGIFEEVVFSFRAIPKLFKIG
ncbi:hypothetical protein [Adhaeribacter arboris]|nr:hypothetical protein [Adhaeribacter arboris]